MDLSIISLEGEFDLTQRSRISDAFAVAKSDRAVIVDFTKASYIDSTVIACLIDLHRAILNHGGRVMLAGLDASFRRVFEISGLSSVFDSTSTIGEAVKTLAPEGARTRHVVLEAG
jgi:anti-anti-sigma factor